MSCTCLRNDKIAHIRSQQSPAEHAGDLPSCEITAPDTACENPSKGGLLKDFINTSALEKKKSHTGSGDEFTQERPLRASPLFLPKVKV